MNFLPVCEPLLDGNELAYVTEAMKSGWISSSGKYVSMFEEAFASYCGCKHGISVCNGTVALHLALTAMGCKKGDEIIIPDFTMIASALAVCYTGATPVFVDADKDTWNINTDLVEAKITPHTKAIMAVHILGLPCLMAPLQKLCDKHGLILLEDAAEAHGALYRGQRTGSLSNIAAFSFFANKNLTTGEGGMVVTNDDALAAACRYYKNMCFPLNAPRDYQHEHIGFNYRMSNLHAAIGLAQTEKAEYYCSLRKKNGLLYRQHLAEIPGVQLQACPGECEHAFWMNGLYLTPDYGKTRSQLLAHLKQDGIDTRLFFNGMHRQRALHTYGCDSSSDYPVSDILADNGFYLPSASSLSAKDIERVCTSIAIFQKS